DAAFFTLNDFRDIRCETIWSYVSRHEGTATTLNYPLMSPPPTISGTVVPGLISWRHLRRNVFPADLYDRLQQLPGFDAQEISWEFENEKKALQHMSDEEIESWVRHHLSRERRWFEIMQYVMETEPADLTSIVFDGVDKLQHSCWRFLFPEKPLEEFSETESRIRELSLQYFRELDGYLEQLVAQAGPETRVFLASDHGFGPTTHVFRVNKWLEQQGYLHWINLRDGEGMRPGHYIPIDWSKTVAFAQSAATNGVHIRVAAEAGQSGVRPEEYAAFRDELAAKLLDVRDPATGDKLVKDVLKREEVFAGPAMSDAPDLTLVMRDHGFISVLNLDPVVWQRPAVSGTHYPQGILIGSGPGIRGGVELPDQEIVDVAPTLLYSLGLPIPESYEGEVIQACFEGDLLGRQPIELAASVPEEGAMQVVGAELDAGEEETILNHLRALGYVE
ncbi:MAG: alkaline phosphatase family protein, partial [Planctomycetales bacterium]|nr:alkaline phosphatase family protein [Planctomycetales bacterium]